MTAKRTQEEALQELAAEHPKLTFSFLDGYAGTRTKVTAVCSTHGSFVKEYRKMTGAGASGCATCSKEASGSIVPFEAYVSRANKIHGEYTYDSEGYTGTNGYVVLVCKEHGKVRASAGQHLRGAKCRYCAKARVADASKVTEAEYFARCKEGHGGKYSYTEGSYKGLSESLSIICKEHGEFEQVAAYHLYSLAGCQLCAKQATARKNTVLFEDFVRRSREVHGDMYEYNESTYTGTSNKTAITCKTHGVFEQVAIDHCTKYGCPKCSGAVSNGEMELQKFVAENVRGAECNARYAGRREFDVLVPEKNLAVEYDGLIWHSTKYRTREEQLRKRADADLLGVELIRIFEHEWRDRRKQVENLLLARLGLIKSKVYARMCQLVEVSNDKAKEFHNEHHIQGWHRTGKSYGLALDGEVLAVMTFTENLSSRKVEEGVHELVRFSSKVQVLGGASRLLKHYVKNHKPEKILSYSDKRLFSGRLYETLGFSKVHDVAPSYSYWREGTMTLQHKSLFRRDNLPSILGTAFDPAKTEKQNCEENGYYQVYDDGKIRWELTPK